MTTATRTLTVKRMHPLHQLAALLLIALVLVGCEKPEDEVQIRRLVDEAIDAAENHRVGDLLDLTTREFVANPNRHDRKQVQGVLLVAFRRYGKFSIEHPPPAIRIADSKQNATVELTFVVVREGQQRPEGEIEELSDDPKTWTQQVADAIGDPYRLRLDLIKDADGWKVREARLRGFKSLQSL